MSAVMERARARASSIMIMVLTYIGNLLIHHTQ